MSARDMAALVKAARAVLEFDFVGAIDLASLEDHGSKASRRDMARSVKLLERLQKAVERVERGSVKS